MTGFPARIVMLHTKYLDRIACGSKDMPRPVESWLLCVYGKKVWWKQGRGGLFKPDSNTSDTAIEELLKYFGIE